jgi:peptide deformylase
MGHPLLLQTSEPVLGFPSEELDSLLEDMLDTMTALDGAGLAAPQIGVLKRVVIFGLQTNPRYPDVEPIPTTVLVNPTVQFTSSDVESGWEGCLSVPGLRGKVDRFRRIRYTGFDQYGHTIDRVAEGFHARVVQHECDHLDGILYPMRIRDLRDFGYEDVLFPELGKDD